MVTVFERYGEVRIDEPSVHPFYRSVERDDLIFAARTRRFWTPEVHATLSIRTVQRGAVTYRIGRTPIRLVPGQFLLLNHGQPYAVEIDEPEPVESTCLYFTERTVCDVLASLEGEMSKRLDQPPLLVDRVYPEAELRGGLQRVRRALAGTVGPDRLELQLCLNEVLATVLRQQMKIADAWESLGARRPSTRREHYRRVHRARDYMHSRNGKVTLGELSDVAGMSGYHFQRLFREVLGTSVAVYSTRLRMERAKRFLAQSDHTIQWIARDAGYEHASSFTRAFQRLAGVTPRAFRRSHPRS